MDVLHLRARTALHVQTRRLQAATSASVPLVTSALRAMSTILAVRTVLERSVSVMAGRAPQHRAQDASTCMSVLAAQDSTDRTAHSSIRVRPRRVSTERPASTYLECSTRAHVRKDSTDGSVSGAHLVKQVRVKTAPRASRSATRSSAHALPDITATFATKVTCASCQQVPSVSTEVHAAILLI